MKPYQHKPVFFIKEIKIYYSPPPPLTPHHTETHYTTPAFFLVFLRTCDPA